MALQLGLPIGCMAATQDCSGGTVLAAGLSQFVGRYWTGEIVLASTSSTCDELVLLGKSSLRAGVAGLGWLPAQGGTNILTDSARHCKEVEVGTDFFGIATSHLVFHHAQAARSW